ncbi:UNVERIFIED_CONTAM: putative mitochondrial protein [Sesamum calycinum]|uniref:Mitochondrial protein n=1 Tax=Sesamum calycinum TaxID=2727403 RepID=A0AAW2JJN3_9LAMI
MVKRNAARNSILAITKADGSIITSAPDIAQEFVDFYTSLLGTDDQTLAVTPAKVKTAVFQISDNKAPGPDGYTSCFFKKAWNIVGDLVCKAVMDFFRNRLSPTLVQLIDSSQAAFVGGRNITDNIFLAQEMVRQYSRNGPRCTSTSTLGRHSTRSHGRSSPEFYTVAMNGSLHGLFPAKKGLRQGDPMSPALFLLCMEYFSRLIKRSTTNSDFNFHPKCEKLKITHLLFADDLMLFSRGDLPSIRF